MVVEGRISWNDTKVTLLYSRKYQISFLDVTIEELTVDFIPMDGDVLSMEIPDFFRDYFLVKFQK